MLLDMDGTLVDSDAAVERAWTAWAADYDLDPAAVLAIAHGTPAERTVSAMLPDLAPDEVARAAAHQLILQYDDLSDVVPTYGAERLISVLARRTMPWAVVTSADRRLAHARLDAAGIPVPVLITSEDVTAGKPAPDAYLLAARTLGVLASRCLVVEDAEPGLRAWPRRRGPDSGAQEPRRRHPTLRSRRTGRPPGHQRTRGLESRQAVGATVVGRWRRQPITTARGPSSPGTLCGALPATGGYFSLGRNADVTADNPGTGGTYTPPDKEPRRGQVSRHRRRVPRPCNIPNCAGKSPPTPYGGDPWR